METSATPETDQHGRKFNLEPQGTPEALEYTVRKEIARPFVWRHRRSLKRPKLDENRISSRRAPQKLSINALESKLRRASFEGIAV